MKQKLNLILWAVDPFQGNGALKHSFSLLRFLFAKNRPKVQPIYVASPLELNLALEFSVPAANRFETAAQKRMEEVLLTLRGLSLEKPVVLIERNPSITLASQRLAEYAKRQKADLVILATHARRGITRAVLGSFTESFLHQSDVPTLVVNPKFKIPKAARTILYPTDFSAASHKAFSKLARLASFLNSKIILHHVVRRPSKGITRQGFLMIGADALTIPEYVARETERRKRQAEAWAKEFGKKASPISIYIEDSDRKTSETILERAKKSEADLIALASQSGRLRAGFLGSTARKVLRNSTLPVWTMRP